MRLAFIERYALFKSWGSNIFQQAAEPLLRLAKNSLRDMRFLPFPSLLDFSPHFDKSPPHLRSANCGGDFLVRLAFIERYALFKSWGSNIYLSASCGAVTLFGKKFPPRYALFSRGLHLTANNPFQLCCRLLSSYTLYIKTPPQRESSSGVGFIVRGAWGCYLPTVCARTGKKFSPKPSSATTSLLRRLPRVMDFKPWPAA